MSDHIMHYVERERARCAALAKAIGKDRSFLIYCIENSVTVAEIDHFRRRFEELKPEDDIEELM